MKKTILIIALMFTALSASAQMKLAHVNSQELLDTMPSRLDALEKLKKFEQDGYQELGEIQKDLEVAYKRYEQNKSTWSPVILKIEEEKIMKKQQLIDTLQSQLPGFYSVEQVIKMINEIEEPQSKEFSLNEEQVEFLVKTIVEDLNDRGVDVIEDYSLEMNYREVELDSVEFDSGVIERVVNDAVDSYIDHYMKKDDCGC
jgi:outer membrane protein